MDLGLVVQDCIQKRVVDFYLSVVVDESEFTILAAAATRRGLRSGICFAPTMGTRRPVPTAGAGERTDRRGLSRRYRGRLRPGGGFQESVHQGHSERVTLFTDMIAGQLEFSAEQRRWLKRAALLHDIGKLGVSNAILDKPGTQIDANCFAALSRALGRIDETLAA
jgi:HD domain-containing protein